MAESSDARQAFRPETVRGTAEFFRVAQTVAGQWWLIDPDGSATWLRAVNGVADHPFRDEEVCSDSDGVRRRNLWVVRLRGKN